MARLFIVRGLPHFRRSITNLNIRLSDLAVSPSLRRPLLACYQSLPCKRVVYCRLAARYCRYRCLFAFLSTQLV